jgi:hypothetical protein
LMGDCSYKKELKDFKYIPRRQLVRRNENFLLFI